MESTNNQNQVDAFTNGPVKPSHYPVTEKPNPSPVKPKKPVLHKKVSTNSFEKAYDFFTSLPVSSALLALIVSQGASINNSSMWYINYIALAVIMFTCVAVGISYLSVPASHRFCEFLFLSLYTPASQVLNISVSLHDSHDDSTRLCKRAKQQTCSGTKVALLMASTSAATHGLCLFSLCRLAAGVAAYHMLSTLLSNAYRGNTSTPYSKTPFSLTSSSDYSRTMLVLSLVLSDFYLSGQTGVLTFIYFLAVDTTVRQIVTDFTENHNLELMEGLDKYFIDGVFQLAEVALCIAVIAMNFYFCILYFAVFYFNVYLPTLAFRQTSARIQRESLCLSNFAKATVSDLTQYDDVCAVCLSSMKYARMLPCKHIFHGKCLKECLVKKHQCPMCNAQVL